MDLNSDYFWLFSVGALLTSSAWGFISSLKREVSSHLLNVRFLPISQTWGFFPSLKRGISFVQLASCALPISQTWGISFACLGIGALLITYTWGVSARLYWPRGHPHHSNVRCSFIHLAMWALPISPAWGIIALISHLFGVSKSTFVATCVVLTHQ